MSSSERASFLGLPTELRLRIYDFLFDPSVNWSALPVDITHPCPKHPTHRDRVCLTQRHCCTWPNRILNSKADCSTECPEKSSLEKSNFNHYRLICSCSQPPEVQILAVSKAIFREAMPILYRNIELRVTMPMGDWNDDWEPLFAEWTPDLTGYDVPHYGRLHVEKLLLVGCVDWLNFYPDSTPWRRQNGFQRYGLSCLNERLMTHYPNVKHIRLHLDVENDSRQPLPWENRKDHQWEEIVIGLQQLLVDNHYLMFPKLQSIHVELQTPGGNEYFFSRTFRREPHVFPDLELRVAECRFRFATMLENALRRRGRQIEVTSEAARGDEVVKASIIDAET